MNSPLPFDELGKAFVTGSHRLTQLVYIVIDRVIEEYAPLSQPTKPMSAQLAEEPAQTRVLRNAAIFDAYRAKHDSRRPVLDRWPHR